MFSCSRLSGHSQVRIQITLVQSQRSVKATRNQRHFLICFHAWTSYWIARALGKSEKPCVRSGRILHCSDAHHREASLQLGQIFPAEHFVRALVRTTAGRTAVGVVDRRCRRDPHPASTQAEDGSAGCTTDFAVAAGRALSPNLGAELGESRSTATALAPAPQAAAPHADHEPTASVALNEGLRCKKRVWRERGRQQLESFRLAPWASRRRRDLLKLLDRLNPTIAELTQAIEQEAEKCPPAQRLRTQLLLDAGAKVDAKDMNGDSPLTWASWSLRPDSILRKLCYGQFSIHPKRRTMDADLRGKPQIWRVRGQPRRRSIHNH